MKKILLMVIAAMMAISACAEEEIVKKVRVYERGNLVYENYYSSVDSIVFVDIIQNPEYSKAYKMGVSGSVDWYNKIDDNTPSLTGDLGSLVNSLVDNISDNDLSNLGMIISDKKDGSFTMPNGCVVILTPSELDGMSLYDALGLQIMTDNNANKYKQITRGGITYNIWILPYEDYYESQATYRDLSI